MATNLHRIIQNFAWNIEAISPQETNRPFRETDPLKWDVLNESGSTRQFYVEWVGSNPDEGPTHLTERTSLHEIQLVIYYPEAEGSWQKLHSLILQDRHDIELRMRDPQYYVGYDDANPTTDIGLWSRFRSGDELNTEDDVWMLTIRYECTINEEEV